MNGRPATRDLTLTDEQRALAKFLRQRFGFKYPFAAHIAKDVLAFLAGDSPP